MQDHTSLMSDKTPLDSRDFYGPPGVRLLMLGVSVLTSIAVVSIFVGSALWPVITSWVVAGSCLGIMVLLTCWDGAEVRRSQHNYLTAFDNIWDLRNALHQVPADSRPLRPGRSGIHEE
jgi:hypothetical protein